VVGDRRPVVGRPALRREGQRAAYAERPRCPERGFVQTASPAAAGLVLADPSTLKKQLRIRPLARDGVTRGFEMYGLRPGSLPKLLGYKNGDVITEINGIPVVDLESGMASYSNLSPATQLTVTIERKGETSTKVLKIAP